MPLCSWTSSGTPLSRRLSSGASDRFARALTDFQLLRRVLLGCFCSASERPLAASA